MYAAAAVAYNNHHIGTLPSNWQSNTSNETSNVTNVNNNNNGSKLNSPSSSSSSSSIQLHTNTTGSSGKQPGNTPWQLSNSVNAPMLSPQSLFMSNSTSIQKTESISPTHLSSAFTATSLNAMSENASNDASFSQLTVFYLSFFFLLT